MPKDKFDRKLRGIGEQMDKERQEEALISLLTSKLFWIVIIGAGVSFWILRGLKKAGSKEKAGDNLFDALHPTDKYEEILGVYFLPLLTLT